MPFWFILCSLWASFLENNPKLALCSSLTRQTVMWKWSCVFSPGGCVLSFFANKREGCMSCLLSPHPGWTQQDSCFAPPSDIKRVWDWSVSAWLLHHRAFLGTDNWLWLEHDECFFFIFCAAEVAQSTKRLRIDGGLRFQHADCFFLYVCAVT